MVIIYNYTFVNFSYLASLSARTSTSPHMLKTCGQHLVLKVVKVHLNYVLYHMTELGKYMWPGIYYCAWQHGVCVCVHSLLLCMHTQHDMCMCHCACVNSKLLCQPTQLVTCICTHQITVGVYTVCWLCLPAQQGTNTVMHEVCHNNLLTQKQHHDAQTDRQGGCALGANRWGRFCVWAILVLKKLFLGHRLAVSMTRTWKLVTLPVSCIKIYLAVWRYFCCL